MEKSAIQQHDIEVSRALQHPDGNHADELQRVERAQRGEKEHRIGPHHRGVEEILQLGVILPHGGLFEHHLAAGGDEYAEQDEQVTQRQRLVFGNYQ